MENFIIQTVLFLNLNIIVGRKINVSESKELTPRYLEGNHFVGKYFDLSKADEVFIFLLEPPTYY